MFFKVGRTRTRRGCYVFPSPTSDEPLNDEVCGDFLKGLPRAAHHYPQKATILEGGRSMGVFSIMCGNLQNVLESCWRCLNAMGIRLVFPN